MDRKEREIDTVETSSRWPLKAAGGDCCSNQEVTGAVELFHSDSGGRWPMGAERDC